LAAIYLYEYTILLFKIVITKYLTCVVEKRHKTSGIVRNECQVCPDGRERHAKRHESYLSSVLIMIWSNVRSDKSNHA